MIYEMMKKEIENGIEDMIMQKYFCPECEETVRMPLREGEVPICLKCGNVLICETVKK